MTDIILTTPPIAPKTLDALHKLGIKTLHDLRHHGSVSTFLLLKATGLTLTYSTLWQLESLIQGINPQTLSDPCKKGLMLNVKKHPPVAIFPSQSEAEVFMYAALEQAKLAAKAGEIPVGAVVVHHNHIIAAAHNRCIGQHDISQHAEIVALAQAGMILKNYRLEECDVYITLEPCAMCASALIQARVKRVIYAAKEPKSGAAGSVLNLFNHLTLNKHTAVQGGILETESQNILHHFFENRRHTSS